MKIDIVGKQIDVGAALSRRIEQKVEDALRKHAHHPVNATITLSKDAAKFRCDCSAHLSTGMVAKATSSDADAYAACDQALNRLEKQLRRHQRRLKDHHQRRKQPIAQIDALAYALRVDHEELHTDTSADEPATDALDPVIVAENRTTLMTLSVGEAALQMELEGTDFILFVNEGQNRLNAVYRRPDGNVGWLDPQIS